MTEREGFYEQMWRDFCSLQRGDINRICKEAEKYRKTLKAIDEFKKNVDFARQLLVIDQAHESNFVQLVESCERLLKEIPRMKP